MVVWGEEDPWEPIAMGRAYGNYPAVKVRVLKSSYLPKCVVIFGCRRQRGWSFFLIQKDGQDQQLCTSHTYVCSHHCSHGTYFFSVALSPARSLLMTGETLTLGPRVSCIPCCGDAPWCGGKSVVAIRGTAHRGGDATSTHTPFTSTKYLPPTILFLPKMF
jgi:hypothetical protein